MSDKKAKADKPAAKEFKYGVEDLAKKMGIQPASARVALRKAEIEKQGNIYGWNSEADMKAVIAKLGPQDSKKPEKKTSAKAKKAEKADA